MGYHVSKADLMIPALLATGLAGLVWGVHIALVCLLLLVPWEAFLLWSERRVRP